MNRRALAFLLGLAAGILAWIVAPYASLSGWWELK